MALVENVENLFILSVGLLSPPRIGGVYFPSVTNYVENHMLEGGD